MFLMALHLCLNIWGTINFISFFIMALVGKDFHLKLAGCEGTGCMGFSVAFLILKRAQQHSFHAAPSVEINVSKDYGHLLWPWLWRSHLLLWQLGLLSPQRWRLLGFSSFFFFFPPLRNSSSWGDLSWHPDWHTHSQSSSGAKVLELDTYKTTRTPVHLLQPKTRLCTDRSLV